MFHSPEFIKAEIGYRVEKIKGSGSRRPAWRSRMGSPRRNRSARLRAKEAWSL